jgi:hypothetical protein
VVGFVATEDGDVELYNPPDRRRDRGGPSGEDGAQSASRASGLPMGTIQVVGERVEFGRECRQGNVSYQTRRFTAQPAPRLAVPYETLQLTDAHHPFGPIGCPDLRSRLRSVGLRSGVGPIPGGRGHA